MHNKFLKPQDLKQLGSRPEPLWGPFARPGEKIFVNAARKSGKTNFCIQLAISLACGIPFLGFPCKAVQVLYIDLELGALHFNERFEESCSIILNKFSISQDIVEGNFHYTYTLNIVDGILKEIGCIVASERIKVIILDSWQLAVDKFTDEVLRVYYRRIDNFLADTQTSLIIVTHFDKKSGTSKQEHNDYSMKYHGSQGDWADAILTLEPLVRMKTTLHITARSTMEQDLNLIYNYPLWYLEKSVNKVELAKAAIITLLKEKGTIMQPALKALITNQVGSYYAYFNAQKELEAEGKIKKEECAGSRYNMKAITLVAHLDEGKTS